MTIELLTAANFTLTSMDAFDRRQVVTYVYRPVDGRLQPFLEPFEEDWSPARRREKAAEILSGDVIAYGALENGIVAGALQLLPELNDGRMLLASLHVSAPFRRQGLGRALFEAAKAEARSRGARALYISACSAVETIDFYTAMGCVVSPAPIPALVEDEPFDIQLECPL